MISFNESLVLHDVLYIVCGYLQWQEGVKPLCIFSTDEILQLKCKLWLDTMNSATVMDFLTVVSLRFVEFMLLKRPSRFPVMSTPSTVFAFGLYSTQTTVIMLNYAER